MAEGEFTVIFPTGQFTTPAVPDDIRRPLAKMVISEKRHLVQEEPSRGLSLVAIVNLGQNMSTMFNHFIIMQAGFPQAINQFFHEEVKPVIVESRTLSIMQGEANSFWEDFEEIPRYRYAFPRSQGSQQLIEELLIKSHQAFYVPHPLEEPSLGFLYILEPRSYLGDPLAEFRSRVPLVLVVSHPLDLQMQLIGMNSGVEAILRPAELPPVAEPFEFT
jgi:hypothetical protein